MPIRSWMGSLIAVVAIAGATGCGYSTTDLCDEICDCVGCNEFQYDECVDDADDRVRRAENVGCDAEADEYLDCLGSEFECRGGDVDLDGCEVEERRVNNCVD